MHQTSVAIVSQGHQPINFDDENIGVESNYEKWAVGANDINFATPGTNEGPGLPNREKSLSFFAHLTRSSRTLGQRGLISKFGPDLSRSNSFGSVASGSVNGIFGDSGDSDLASSDDDFDKGVRIRRKNARRRQSSPWITLDQLRHGFQVDEQVAIFNLKNSTTPDAGVLIDNLSVSNAAESDDILDQVFSREDAAFRSMEVLNGSNLSFRGQRLPPAFPPSLRGSGINAGRRLSAFRRVAAAGKATTLQEMRESSGRMAGKIIPVKPLLQEAVKGGTFIPLSRPDGGNEEVQRLKDSPSPVKELSVRNGIEATDSSMLNSLVQQELIQVSQLESNDSAVPSLTPEGRAPTAPKPSSDRSKSTTTAFEGLGESISKQKQRKDPSFQRFMHFSMQRSTLTASIGDENLFHDEGPRHLDAFALFPISTIHVFPRNGDNHIISPEELAPFCIPDGLRVRLVPRVAVEGAKRLGWLDKEGDRSHVFVVPDGSNKYHHGVAIRVRDIAVLPAHEMAHFVRTVRVRQRRRRAASSICRWYKLVRCRHWIIAEAIRFSGYPKHPKDFDRVLTIPDLKRLERMISKIVAVDTQSNGTESAVGADSAVKTVYEYLDATLKTFTEKTGFPRRQSFGNLLSRGFGSRQLATTNESNSRQRKRIGNSTRLVKSERIAARSVSSRVVREGRRVSSERISFLPSFRKVLSSSKSTKKDLDSPCAVRILAKEAMETAEYAEMRGFVLLVEQCYCVIGCRPNESVLLLNSLQQLVDTEREELGSLRSHLAALNPTQRSRVGKVWDAAERRVLSNLEEQRDQILASILDKAQLTESEKLVGIPPSQLEAIRGPQHYFETQLPIPKALPIRLPLPLPGVGQEWGLAKLILTIGPDSLIRVIKVLLIERSVLILGEDFEDITACCCALVELLKPFEVFHSFMPVLSRKALDSVIDSQPFVGGLASHDLQRLVEVENDPRVRQAKLVGLSIINVSSGMFHVTSEPGVAEVLGLDPDLSERLRNLRCRLQHYVNQDLTSPLLCFKNFVQYGLSPHERITLRAVCSAFEGYILRLCGTLSTPKTDWKRYGTEDADTRLFRFQPELFLQALDSDQRFLQLMVTTKYFSAYIGTKMQAQRDVDEMKSGRLGKFIATWIYNRWTEQKYRQSLHQ